MRRLVPLLVFVAVACLITWPLAAHLSSRLGATAEYGDPYFNLWVLGWNLTTLSRHPGWLLTGRIFNAPFFFPATGTLAYSDHQIPQALTIWPLYAATGDVVLCYNVLLILSLAVSAWAMFAFVREVTGSSPAGYAAGLAWGFWPYRITHLPHIQLQALYWMPVTFWLMHRLVAGRRKRDAVALGVAFAMQALSSVYYGVIGGIGLMVAAAVVVTRSGKVPPTLVARFALAAVVAIVVAGPGLLPYWRVQQREGFGRNISEAEHNSATWRSYVHAPPANLLYGRTGLLLPGTDDQGVRPRDEPEKDLFPGFIVAGLAVIGLLRGRERRRVLTLSMAAVGVAGLLLSLGPLGIRTMYVALHEYVFGFHAIRAPARFSVLLFFAAAVLGGLGLQALLDGRKSGRAKGLVAGAALILMTLEFTTGAIVYAPAPDLTTDVGQWLRDAPESGPVLYLPIGRDRDDAQAMLASLEHGRPILNGYSGQRPALYPAVVDAVAQFPDASALLTLRELGVRFVVTKERLAPASLPARVSPLVERVVYSGGAIYELRWTPEAAAAFDDLNTIVPPPPGPVPFRTSETLRYDVRWIGGPMAVAAGTATITTDRSDDDGWRMRVRAQTADWVRPFFEADDELSVEMGTSLLPRVYREALSEGHRHARRTVTFDPAGRRVTVTNGGTPPVVLPLQNDARDPLSALLYVRTLPIAQGFRATIPVSDAGRSTSVDVIVTGVQSIVAGGRRYDAWRIEPTFVTRLAWRAPPRAVVWVSRDERRVPLLIRVSAAFGTLEVELTGGK